MGNISGTNAGSRNWQLIYPDCFILGRNINIMAAHLSFIREASFSKVVKGKSDQIFPNFVRAGSFLKSTLCQLNIGSCRENVVGTIVATTKVVEPSASGFCHGDHFYVGLKSTSFNFSSSSPTLRQSKLERLSVVSTLGLA